MLTNLKLLRNEKGISQQKLADKLGISQQSINKYENHNIEPEIDTLKKLADFFGTSIDYITGYTDIPYKIKAFHRNDLNTEENTLLEKFRLLPAKARKNILSLMDDLISNK